MMVHRSRSGISNCAVVGLVLAAVASIAFADVSEQSPAEDLWDEEQGDKHPPFELVQSMPQEPSAIRDPPQLDKDAVAASVESHIDTKVNPCEDFYQHACGNWLKTFELPGDHAEWTRSFNTISKRVKQISRDILEEKKVVSEDAVPKVLMQKLITFYKVCNDDAALNRGGLAPVKGFLQPRLARVTDVPSFMQVLAELGEMGLDKLFSFGIGTDPKSPGTHVTSLGQGGLGLPDRSYYIKDQYKEMVAEKYVPLIKHTLESVALDSDPSSDKPTDELVEAVLEFEKKLAHITVDRTDLRDPVKTYHMLSKQQLFELSPALQHYFDARTKQGSRPGPRMWQLSPKLYTDTPSFFQQLPALLNSTPMPVLRAYLRWHIGTQLASSLSDEISYPYFKFYSKELSGVKERTPRWERCYGAAGGHMPHIMARAFVSEAFKGDSKAKAQNMIEMIEGAFGETLQSLPWLDDTTRNKAKVKLGALVDMIGYPEKWHTYAKAILSDNHLSNILALDRIANDRNLDKLGKPVDKKEWGMSPASVNAYYDPEVNKIVFPAAILQPPFFDTSLPMALNFGAIGVVMGHELTHGFDDEGRKYDKDGVLHDWWAESTSKKFDARAQCVIDQYSAFQVPGSPKVNLNGKLTLGENLADNGGVQNSFKAYSKWAAQQPGGVAGQACGRFSGAQLFFYGFAQSWCTKQAVKAERQQAVTDPHSPAEFRVNGALHNSAAFSEAFQCKPGSKMNPGPGKRCLVWDNSDK